MLPSVQTLNSFIKKFKCSEKQRRATVSFVRPNKVMNYLNINLKLTVC